MHVGYSSLRKGLCLSSKQLTVALGLIALPFTVRLQKIATATPLPAKPAPVNPKAAKQATPDHAPEHAMDLRILRLKRFFARLHSPATTLAQDFVNAADDNQLDWRLLPGISIVESGGGKEARNNNIFGWANGNEPFPTIRSGIHEVAYKLGHGWRYKNRDVMGKLKVYNPDESYAKAVLDVMNRISPDPDLQPVSRLIFRKNEFIYATE